jgi:xylulose-5-phosphate/fructose-6-phosphate phosphoketolase
VRGYKEEGTTTTPFDMTVVNELDRFHLAEDAVKRCKLGADAKPFIQMAREKLKAHSAYIRERGEDMPEIRGWRWDAARLGPR